MKRRAFTLIEMLTVIVITAILLSIIVVPVMQSVNLVSLASSYNQAQQNARDLLTEISREVANSAGVRDNSGQNGAVAVTVPTGPGSTNPTVTLLLPYSKLDIVNVAQGSPASGPNYGYNNASIGKVDPTLQGPKGQVVLPIAPGTTITRYFIALRDPLAADGVSAASYNDPYSGILMARSGGQDNLYVLYKATVSPYKWNTANNTYAVNTDFFQVDGSGRPILDDPYFMVPDGTAAKAAVITHWIQSAKVVTQLSRFDMIQPDYNKATGKAIYKLDTNGDYVPQLVSLLQFRPELIPSQTATAQTPYRLGAEGDNSGSYGPDVFRTQYGGWSEPIINITQPDGTVLTTTDTTRSDASVGFSQYAGATELFDVSAYLASIGGVQKYPFSYSLQQTLNRSNWIAGSPALAASFEPISFDSVAGKVYGSFPISEVGINPLPPTASDPSGARANLPMAAEGTQLNYQADPQTTAVFGGTGYAVNDAFNRAMSQFPDQAGNIKRIIDLRVTPNEDGTYGPLFPTQTANFPAANVVVSGNQNGFARAAIVPGSEVVYGPDQNPGPNYGNEVRYTRISTGNPGPNQYRINYAGQTPPAGFLTNFTAAELNGFDPNVYDPNSFVSAMMSWAWAPGVITLNSDPNQPIPNTVPFRISYRFEFTNQNDAVSVSYGTRQVLSLLITIRTYPQSSSTPNPQEVTLKSTAAVRNFIRS